MDQRRSDGEIAHVPRVDVDDARADRNVVRYERQGFIGTGNGGRVPGKRCRNPQRHH